MRRIHFALTPAEWVLYLDVKRLNDEAKLPGWIGKALDPAAIEAKLTDQAESEHRRTCIEDPL